MPPGCAASQAQRMRADLEIIAFERGAYTSYSACGVPYFVGGWPLSNSETR
jgi:hypothetical protein